MGPNLNPLKDQGIQVVYTQIGARSVYSNLGTCPCTLGPNRSETRTRLHPQNPSIRGPAPKLPKTTSRVLTLQIKTVANRKEKKEEREENGNP